MIEIDVSDVERFARKLRALPPELRLEQRKAVSAAAAVLRDEVQRRIHSPGGHARKGIKIKLKGSGAEMEARIVAGNRAAVFSQRSRGPNTTPPPMRSARAMARRYGIPIAQARPLALAIARRGTRGRPVMRAAASAAGSKAVALFRAALEAVARKAAQR